MNNLEIIRFKRQILAYEAYINGYAFLRWSKKKNKAKIALTKKTWHIINYKMKKFKMGLK